ncbi:hypothetical protein EVAR_10952_1 [Eumeta japonica]|uniref:Uncharacterized protein n=1 Tax=Eumeta variegata TaxID=151549 RepID=A0A4C1U745_EUMVA|nr:hypothetical protein EVAR_10952_1 [Eumeta japonica]
MHNYAAIAARLSTHTPKCRVRVCGDRSPAAVQSRGRLYLSANNGFKLLTLNFPHPAQRVSGADDEHRYSREHNALTA